MHLQKKGKMEQTRLTSDLKAQAIADKEKAAKEKAAKEDSPE